MDSLTLLAQTYEKYCDEQGLPFENMEDVIGMLYDEKPSDKVLKQIATIEVFMDLWEYLYK